MKTEIVTYGLHRYRDENKNEQFLLSDGKDVTQYDEVKFAKVVKKLKKGTRIISSSANPTDSVLATLAKAGAEVLSAHWHATGIPKNLPAEEIAARFAMLPDELLRPINIRSDIMQLKNLVNMRRALIEYRKTAQLRLSAVVRAMGQKTTEHELVEEEINKFANETESPIDKDIKKLAKTIPDCIVLHRLMGTTDAWMSAAGIISQIGDIRRFPMVSSLWHYAGLHGPNTRRKKGVAHDWNSKLKTTLYTWASACMRSNVPLFRQRYDRYRAEERAIHETKCKCKTPDGHSTMRAMRRVEKDLLKDFWVAMNKQWEKAA
jgi:hypothetical protein